ncbi:hypothetical protein P692DRAFT_20876376 [Suillus brevipes Sb2]|nr:hypothetical protein P692DRAFT_20876376 [Suillus brevipes Sb2]
MGRPRLYNSPEEKAQAARHYRKAYIERNRKKAQANDQEKCRQLHDKSINIDQKLFMIIGKSSYEFVEGLCRALIECEDSEVWKVFQSIRAAFDTVEDLEEEASELEDVVLMRVREVRVALQDIIAYVRIGPEALDEAYEKEEIYHQYSDSICY